LIWQFILEDFSLKKFRANTTAESMEGFLAVVRKLNYYQLKTVYAELIAVNLVKLVELKFPFHKVGKIVLTQTFRRICELQGGCPRSSCYEEDEEIDEF
jgi:hypothetical protein